MLQEVQFLKCIELLKVSKSVSAFQALAVQILAVCRLGAGERISSCSVSETLQGIPYC